MQRFVVISGCSGGGKSTLLTALQQHGYGVVAEPGLRVIQQAQESGSCALPWCDMDLFVEHIIALATTDLAAAKGSHDGIVFFDRGLIDALAAKQRLHPESQSLDDSQLSHCYDRCVFLTPPWPEIYEKNDDRQHSIEAATAEYEHLLQVYAQLGYHIHLLPKTSVQKRVDFVLHHLALTA
ncbi:AAA family ATPase [Paenalcaligenes sp. Me131]|uniref:AAA family ATPase n=1 Tax=Paenalcaligenes sp. Me131 TaxID=3392636 RepID=UPI003D2AB8A6